MSYNTLYFYLKLPLNYPIFCSEYACRPVAWIDRLDYCLPYLDEIPALEDGLSHSLPESLKGNFEDVDLIIDCTEVFIERPSETIAQSATLSEYK